MGYVLDQWRETTDPAGAGCGDADHLCLGYPATGGLRMPLMADRVVMLRRELYPEPGAWMYCGSADPADGVVGNEPSHAHLAGMGYQYSAARLHGNGYRSVICDPVRVDFDGDGDLITPALPAWPIDASAAPVAGGKFLVEWTYDPFGDPWSDKQTCNWYTGFQYPPTIACTGRFLGDRPMRVDMTGGFLGRAGTIGLGRWNYTRTDSMAGATSNVAALCWGEVADEGSGCYPHNDDDEFNDASNIFSELYVRQIAASILEDPSSPQRDQLAHARVKNMALQWLNEDILKGALSLTHLDRLDLWNVDQFTRAWWATHWGEAPVVATWSNCRGRHTGLPITVDVHLASAEVSASIVLYRTVDRTACEFVTPGLPYYQAHYNARPLIRFKISLRLAYRATFGGDGPHQHVRAWLPEDDDDRVVDLAIDNDFAIGRPSVTSPEEIIYVDSDGLRFDGCPPRKVEWHGHLGHLTAHDVEDHMDHEYLIRIGGSSLVRYHCCAVAKGMYDVHIPALESHVDRELETTDIGETERHGVYRGEVRAGFRWTLLGFCPP